MRTGHFISWHVATIKKWLKLLRLFIRTSPNLEDLPCELVSGDGYIYEELLGLRFRISPHSFFQVDEL